MATIYQQDALREISFPLGGIGTGSVGLAGNGRLVDWQIANRPNVHSTNGFSHFAVKAQQGDRVLDARVLQGDFTGPCSGGETSGLRGNNGFGHGVDRCTMAGVPHFKDVTFEGDFPLARVHLAQPTFPGRVQLDAFSPFIPSNSADSSLPAAFFTVRLTNTTEEALDYTVAFSVNNLAAPTACNRFEQRKGFGCLYFGQEGVEPDHPHRGNLAISCPETDLSYQEDWFRGEWFDSLTVFWKEFCRPGKFKNRRYAEPSATPYIDRLRGLDMGTLAAHIRLAPGESHDVRFLLTWSFPNYQNDWHPIPDSDPIRDNTWKNYYATVFGDARDTADYALTAWDRLEGDTKKFAAALSGSSLPEKVRLAVSNTLSVLHSPTCLRLTDGSFYAWEGCNPHAGCCEGSCTHVWNYNYALPMLFPDLERSMHDVHFQYDLKPDGALRFRTQLPLGRKPKVRPADGKTEQNYWDREPWEQHACADGQFGDVLCIYREYMVSGDREWLKRIFPAVKKALAYTWSSENHDRWDPDASGVLTGRQHHTLDMELFGPSSWLNGLYMAAMQAAGRLARELDDLELAETCQRIFSKGCAWMEQHLFNGSYYQQNVKLDDYDTLAAFGQEAVDIYWNDEAGQMKYQLGGGCSIDQLLGQWHANLCHLGDIFDPDIRKIALKNLFKNNFRESFRDHFNGCRNYALNDEGGLLMCSWPEGSEFPLIPIPYSDEVMTGFEYAAGCLMIQEGMEAEGLRCVEKVRERYDGVKRNPFNEIECGSYYARPMAAWGFLLTYSGFSCDMSRGKLGFAPIHPKEDFRYFFSVDGAWGTIAHKDGAAILTVDYGTLPLQELTLDFLEPVQSLQKNGKVLSFTADGHTVRAPLTLTAGDVLTLR